MNVLHASADIEVVAWDTVEKLKRLAEQHASRRSRLCLHRGPQDLTHEMIIVAHASTYIRPHRHPREKSESYHVIEGKMEIRLFDENGRVQRVVTLTCGPGGTFMYRMTNGWWHQPVPKTEWLVYHETYSGPFDKGIDVQYAPWAPEEA